LLEALDAIDAGHGGRREPPRVAGPSIRHE
jgi:hypothetical protein